MKSPYRRSHDRREFHGNEDYFVEHVDGEVVIGAEEL